MKFVRGKNVINRRPVYDVLPPHPNDCSTIKPNLSIGILTLTNPEDELFYRLSTTKNIIINLFLDWKLNSTRFTVFQEEKSAEK